MKFKTLNLNLKQHAYHFAIEDPFVLERWILNDIRHEHFKSNSEVFLVIENLLKANVDQCFEVVMEAKVSRLVYLKSLAIWAILNSFFC